MFEKTKAKCDSFLEMGVPGFDLLIYRDGKEFFRYTGGFRDLENRIPMTGTERLRLYSCTKPITVTAALQLWEQGKFSLEDPLYAYLPAFRDMTVQTEDGIRKAENPILIRHLFAMTAGFSCDYRSPSLMELRRQNPAPTTRQVVDALAGEPLLFEPGDRYRYCLGHDVLGALVEVVSGESLQDYVHRHIFAPLGMDKTTYFLPDSEQNTVAPIYRFHKDISKPVREEAADRVGPAFVSGGGGCVTTAADYMKFAEALRDGERLLKRSTIRRLCTDRLTEHQRRTFTIKTADYGLGMWVPKEGQLRQDFGWGGAAGAMLAVDPGRGLSVVYLQHLLESPNQGMRSTMLQTFLMELEEIEDTALEQEDVRNYNLTY